MKQQRKKVDNGFRPNIGSVGLSKRNFERLRFWRMDRQGTPAPTEHPYRAAVWYGQLPSIYHEVPVLSAVMPRDSLRHPATQWFFGILREKLLHDAEDPIVMIVNAAEYPVLGAASSIQGLALAIDILGQFIPPEQFQNIE